MMTGRNSQRLNAKSTTAIMSLYRWLLRLMRRARWHSYTPKKGCGRVPGVIEIGWRARSLAAFRAYHPPKRMAGAQRFVFDPDQQILIVGNARWQPLSPGSPHEQLAQVIGAYRKQGGQLVYPRAAGGMLSKTDDGTLITNEKSPHLGHNWTPEVRLQFISFIQMLTGMSHQHHSGS